MTQIFHRSVSPGATPFVSDPFLNDRNGEPPLGNLSAHETGGVACTIILAGPDGDSTIDVAANGTGACLKKRASQVRVTGNGATVSIDFSGPDEFQPPQYLFIAGTSKVDVTQQEAGLSLDASLGTLNTTVSAINAKLTTVSTSHGTVLAVHDQGA